MKEQNPKKVKLDIFLPAVLFAAVGLCAGCYTITTVPTAQAPYRIAEICAKQPAANLQIENAQYHSFIAMVDVMTSYKWKITEAEMEKGYLEGEICKFEDLCTQLHATVDAKGGISFYFSTLSNKDFGYLQWTNNINNGFNDISCYPDSLIQERIAKKGFQFSPPAPAEVKPQETAEPAAPASPEALATDEAAPVSQ